MRRSILTLWSALLFSAHLLWGNDSAASVQLSVAASLTDATKALSADFGKTHPEIDIFFNFGSSGALAKQIEQGAPVDIFISAHPKWMKHLADKNLVDTSSERVFGYNTLVFTGDPKLQPLKLVDTVQLKRIAIGIPESVPAGQYAKQALTASGLWDTLEQGNRLMLTQDVRQALIYADRGEVDGAFVYKTDALLAKNATILFNVPTELHDQITYPIALTMTGKNNGEARALFEYLKTPKADAIIAGFGFESAR